MSQLWMIHGVVRAPVARPPSAPPHDVLVGEGLAMLVSPAAPELAHAPPVSEADAAAAEREALAAMHHNAVLTAYCAVADVAPVRFGAAVSTRAAAEELLHRDAPDYAATLDRLAGCVEFALRVIDAPRTDPHDTAVPDDTGRGHLARIRRLRDLRSRCDTDQARALAALADGIADHARDTAAISGARVRRRLDIALLVARTAEAGLVGFCRTAHDRLAPLGLTLSLIGPWPPYSFTTPPGTPQHGSAGHG